ncbi:hypothetical protein RchiOBHm_Chr6g0279171 [Rosa chinensis]|uniref:Uncharacterized protein n=1 Tax=Rosa chinensis TaxID=74649 RepID=A0A2P6PT00_ROSCH|nr:hypothetical protein RchiOBHm_Chr6g0279171 [Rosa chinensis]
MGLITPKDSLAQLHIELLKNTTLFLFCLECVTRCSSGLWVNVKVNAFCSSALHFVVFGLFTNSYLIICLYVEY